MRRGFGLLLLLLSLLCQSVVMAGGRALPIEGEDLAHTVLHWQDEAHHHHDDGSYHFEDSGEALAHVQLDGAVHLTALLGPDLSIGTAITAAAPTSVYALHLPTPPPQPLRRPPRSLS
jgi:hypothetical protein